MFNKIIKNLLILSVLLSISIVANAATWTSKAMKLFEDDDYEACIKLAENYKDDNQATMFLAFSHLQENIFNKSEYDKQKFKAYSIKLDAKLGINDLDNLFYFVNLNDKPLVVKEARNLIKKVFKNINDIDDVPKLVSFLKVDDEDTKKLALSTIQRILKPKRDYVNKGGSLREKDIAVMNSKTVITALIQQISLSPAKASLLLIEEPVLAYLSTSDSLEASKLELAINKKVEARKKKYPESSWHSAVGKKR